MATLKNLKRRVGFVQFAPKILDVDGNVERALSLAEKTDADLLVLPELFNSGYAFQSRKELAEVAEEVPAGATTKALLDFSGEKKNCVVAGIAEREGSRFYNSAVIAYRGKLLGTYRKTHLFGAIEKAVFSPGDSGFKVFDVGGMNVGVMVCFDWLFPESMRTLALMGADVVAHPANLVLPFCPDALKTRCMENRVYAAMADIVGQQRGLQFQGLSEVVAPDGSVVYRAGAKKAEAKSVEMDLSLARSKLLKSGNDLFAERRPEFYRLR